MTDPDPKALASAGDSPFHRRTASLSGMMTLNDEHQLVIDGRFVVLTEIGRGGFGAVYRCFDRTYGRNVAIKQLLPPNTVNPDPDAIPEDPHILELRLQTEMQIMARLDHPNIVHVHEYVNHSEVADRCSYIVMEYLEGTSLFDYMHQRGRIPVEEAVVITEQLLNALRFIHSHHFIHRDLKPENVFVLDPHTYALSQTHIKLLDFGLAIYKQASQRLTREGLVGGTVWYLSPEQCDGLDADEQSDLYSVGMMLFEILTGDLPYVGRTHNEKLVQKLKHEYGNWSMLRSRAHVHPDLERVIHRALAVDRRQRFASADAMLAELKALRERGALALVAPSEDALDLVPIDLAIDPDDPGPAAGPPVGTSAPRRLLPPTAWLGGIAAALVMGWLIVMGVVALSSEGPGGAAPPPPAAEPPADDGAGAGAAPASAPGIAAEAEPEPEPEPAEHAAAPAHAGELVGEPPPGEADDDGPPPEGVELVPPPDEGTEPPGEQAQDEPERNPGTSTRARRRRRSQSQRSLSIPRMEMEQKRRPR